MGKNNLSDTLLTLILLYIIIIKTIFACSHLFCFGSDFPILITDAIIIFFCIVKLLSIWRNRIVIKKSRIWWFVLLSMIFILICEELYISFSLSPGDDVVRLLWTYLIPNFFAILILIYILYELRP